jgi:hypothetical protein
MKNEPTSDLIIRFSVPFRIAVLLITLAALWVCIPLAVQTIPMEAFGYLFVLVLFPGVLVYGSFFVFAYQIQIKDDRIAAEAVPNPFLHSFQCRYADISGIEKDTGWSNLFIYRFREPEPRRILTMDILDASPILLLEKFTAYLPGEIFIERITNSLRRWWKWHKLLINIILLLGAGWFSIGLLDAGGMLRFMRIPWEPVITTLIVAAFVAAIVDLLIIRIMNRET